MGSATLVILTALGLAVAVKWARRTMRTPVLSNLTKAGAWGLYSGAWQKE